MNNQVFRALADPTRREILRLLGQGEMSAGELANRFEMTKPSMSHHFTVLKEADLVTCRREGQQLFYAINTTVAQDVLAWLWELLAGQSANGPSAVPAPRGSNASQGSSASQRRRAP